ncbi:Crp/Fnr family transcriptional regulator [Streptomyces sp. NPDC056948]|uniref:Crp/Fnr family transcriptional regulator n=1 Tax=Streptomyces sp. NPDC056948 TaxID=3345975 RepID=UPI003642FEF5
MSQPEWPAGRRGAGALLPRLPAATVAELRGIGRRVTYRPGAVLLTEGERTRHALLLWTGWVKVVATRGRPQPTLLALRGPGDMVGELGALDGRPRTASVLAVSPVTALLVAESDLHGWLRRAPEAGLVLHQYMSSKLREATRFRLRATDPVEMRTAGLLRSLSGSYGSEEAGGTLITAPLTQQEIAALVGASRAQVQRALAALRGAGAISTGYRSIMILDGDGLARLAGEAG